MKKGFLVVLLLLIGACALYAQSEAMLRGTIRAKADGSPVSNATIRLEGTTTFQAASSGDGTFSIQHIVPGVYSVVVSHPGFADERQQITLKPREVAAISLELSLSALAQTVDVQSTPATVSSDKAPNAAVLQSEQIDLLPTARRTNLPDMIASAAPGMVRSHDDFVHVRGNEISLNAFLNGVAFWENPHTVLSSGLTPDIIQSASILTGAFPAEYGNRFGGVVDVVTKSGLSRDNGGSVTIGVGTALRHNAAVEYGGHTSKLGYYLYSAGFESARFLSPNDPRSIHDTGRGMHHFLQFDYNLNPKNLLKLMVMGDGANFQIPKTSGDDQVRPGLDANQQTRGESAVLTWSHAASGNTLLTTSLYQRWSSMSFDQTGEPLASVAQNSRTLWTTGIKGDLTMLLKRHTIKGGIDLVRLRPEESLFFYGEGYVALSHVLGLPHSHLRGPDRGPITFNGEEAGGEASVYVQDSFEWTRNLRTQVGLRFDRYDLKMSSSHFSPRVSASYRLSERGTTLHASYDHFFVPPAVENVLISSAGLTRYVQGFDQPLPPLRPIVENQVELGLTQPVHRNLRVSATGYYRESKGPVHTVLFPDTRIYAYANFDKGKAYGLELKADVPVVARLGISAYVNYALSRVYFWNPITAGFVDEDHHFGNTERFLAPMDQTHSLNGGVTYRNRRGFWVSTTAEYGSGTPLEEAHETEASGGPQRVPVHFTQDLSFGVDLLRNQDQPRLSLQFNVENVTNNVYVVSQESTFSPGEYYNPRFFSSSLKIRF
jgi:hypothetical protein